MGIAILLLGLALFFVPHLLRELNLREALLSRLGSEGAYKGVYSLLALLGLALIVWGKSTAPFVMVWEPRYELRWVSLLVMLPAMVFVVAGNLPTSHLSKQLRHPMLLGVALFGAAHLWANGDLSSLLLFGGFLLWSGFKFFSLLGQTTSKKASILWDAITLIAGLVFYLIIAVFHGQLFGVGLNFAQ